MKRKAGAPGRKDGAGKAPRGGAGAPTTGARRTTASKGVARPGASRPGAAKAGGQRKAAPWLPDSFDAPRPARGAAEPRGSKQGFKIERGPVGRGVARTPAVRESDSPSAALRTRAKTTAPHAEAIRRDDPHAAREASRYERPIASREAIIELLGDAGRLMTAEAIGDALELRDTTDLEALKKRLAAMVRDGQLLQNRRGCYGVAERMDLIPGVIIANADGYGFLRPADGSEDLYLAPAQMRTVLHGDRVLANVVGLDRRGRREGGIVEVLERRAARLVGRYQDSDGIGVVVPDDRRIHQDLLIPQGKSEGAKAGQIVVAEIVEQPTRDRPPIGRVVAVLGERLTASLAVKMAIESKGLPHEWPQDVMREAEAVEPTVSAVEREDRMDLRALPLVTIDGEDARDFDDAVYCERLPKGFRLIVAIADVSHYVRMGTPLDHEAYLRSTSVYFPDFVVPMLPEVLSNGICSLMPKVERLCMVCEMLIDHSGVTKKSRFYPAVMKSHARLTYNQVWAALGEKSEDAIASVEANANGLMDQLDNLYAVYQALAAQRRKRGAIDFESHEVKFRLAPDGEVLAMGAYERNDAHKLIEECMIAANVEAAKFVEAKKVPAPFRVHAPPPMEKYEDLVEFLKEFKLKMPTWEDVTPGDFANLIRKVKDRPDSSLLESVLLRSQSLAVYYPENGGHFGLALDAYAHFTSPIRRYPDLLLHRAIRHAVAGGKPSDYEYGEAEMVARCAQCSQNERRADEAEREVDERFKVAWMEKHVGTEFDGVVSGVTSFGLFVELIESRVTGLVHVTQLPNDYYHFDAKRHLMMGERRGLQFRLGDKVRVLVLRASLEDRKIDFRLVGAETDEEVSTQPPGDFFARRAGGREGERGRDARGSDRGGRGAPRGDTRGGRGAPKRGRGR